MPTTAGSAPAGRERGCRSTTGAPGVAVGTRSDAAPGAGAGAAIVAPAPIRTIAATDGTPCAFEHEQQVVSRRGGQRRVRGGHPQRPALHREGELDEALCHVDRVA